MISINPQEKSVPEIQRLLQGGIAPRPIALVSTTGSNGDNLSPFSFFNVFSSRPPVVVFSPARRGKDGSLKDTYNNIAETRECVIQAVTYAMVQQVSLASTEYPTGTDEFVKSGLTKVASALVKAPGVKESPFRMECKVKDIIQLGTEGGAGNLIVCEIVLIHLDETVLTGNSIDPHKIDLVARMGNDYYCRAQGEAIFEVEKPVVKKGIGIDALPEFIRNSSYLSGNDLGKLGNLETLPDAEEIGLLKAELLELTSLAEESETRQTPEYKVSAAVLLSPATGKETEKIFDTMKKSLEGNDARFALTFALLMREHLQ